MSRSIFIVLFSLFCFSCLAQEQDSLKAIRKDGNWAIQYVVKPGEFIRMLALRFSLSENAIINANEPEKIRLIGPGSVIIIPIQPENYFTVKQPLGNQSELYYKVAEKDDIGLLSTYSGVTKTQMRSWNSLKGNTLHPDQVLFIGWVKMIPRDTSNPATMMAYPSHKKKPAADSLKAPVSSGFDTVYARQTMNGQNILTEKGTAVFFEKAAKGGIYLAFHNTARRGTIIKVNNPGNGKYIYARVLGPIPETKQFSNSIIGISESAKDALGVSDNKAWCELSYSPN